MTKLFICSPSIPGNNLIRYIKSLGFEGLRVDLFPFRPSVNRLIISQAAGHKDLKWIFVMHGGFMTNGVGDPLTPVGAHEASMETLKILGEEITPFDNWSIEVGNEPNLAPTNSRFKDPYVMAKLWNDILKELDGSSRMNNVNVISPAPGGLGLYDGYDYLSLFLDYITEWNDRCKIGIHRYIPSIRDPNAPEPGWGSREQELEALKYLVKDKPVWVTETGISVGPHYFKRDFPLCWFKKEEYISSQRQGELIIDELEKWKDLAEIVSLYQLIDGPNREDKKHGYGIMYHDMSAKSYAPKLSKVFSS